MQSNRVHFHFLYMHQKTVNHCFWYFCDRKMPSSMYARLCTVAASNNRVHALRLLYYCLFTPCIYILLFFTHIPFVVNHIFNTTPPDKLQQYVTYMAEHYRLR